MKACCFPAATLACGPLPRDALHNLDGSDLKVYSQNGEDGVIRAILWAIGTTNRNCVEFGSGDGSECNTRLLVHQGWRFLWMDCGVPDGHPTVKREQVTAENIVALFEKYEVPRTFDCLSIDTDLNDPYLLAAILRDGYRPRLVVTEYNAGCGPEASVAVRYDPSGMWRGTDYFGGSLMAFVQIGRRWGYELVYCEASGNNAFFVERDLVDPARLRPPHELWRPPGYGGHAPDPEHKMIPFMLD
jgi:hypothetical protein